MDSIWTTWGDAFNASFKSLWMSLAHLVPSLVLAIVLFVIGWILGNLVAKAIEQVFSSLKVDKFFASLGAENFFRKAGVRFNTGHFIGQVVKWFIVIVFLLPSLNLVLPATVYLPDGVTRMNPVTYFLEFVVLGYLVKIVVAALILIIAAVVSDGISKSVKASAMSMGIHTANLFSTIAKYSVWIFAFIIALGQLGVAENYMNAIFIGIIAMISIGGALAFGLGGRDAASRLIAKLEDEVSHKGM